MHKHELTVRTGLLYCAALFLVTILRRVACLIFSTSSTLTRRRPSQKNWYQTLTSCALITRQVVQTNDVIMLQATLLINSEEEAALALQVSNALTQTLLRYRMNHRSWVRPNIKVATKTTNAIQDVDKMRCQFQHVWCNLWISNRLTVLLGEKAQFGEDWSREERYAREVLICSLLREARTCCCFSHGVIKLRKMTHATFSSANRSLITIDWWPCSCLDRDFSCLDRSVIVFVLLLLLLFRTSIR